MPYVNLGNLQHGTDDLSVNERKFHCLPLHTGIIYTSELQTTSRYILLVERGRQVRTAEYLVSHEL
jgi:hypothetical protein